MTREKLMEMVSISRRNIKEDDGYTYPQAIEKYFPSVGDLTNTCPHCGKNIKSNQ